MVCWPGHQVPRSGTASVGPSLLRSLRVFPELVVQTLARTWLCFPSFRSSVCLEPVWGPVLVWILHDGDPTHCTSSSVGCPGQVHVCFPQHHKGGSSPHTFNCSDGKGNLPSPTDVGAECLRMWWTFSGVAREMVAASAVACKPPVKELCFFYFNKKFELGTTLVVQWLRIYLPMQGTRV